MPKIKRLLVANRGEIALRIMRTAREMGITTVAIYSDADRHMPYVLFADEAYPIGPAPSAQSYLRGDAIVALCKTHNIDAIHPGYGFLSENAGFAKAVTDAGIRFLGPTAEAMDMMGDKLAAKHSVKAYNVPMVPGVDHAITDVNEAIRVAEEIGYPVLIKASAGGGGKGMRTVENSAELASQMERAQSEALNSFGNSSVFIEKFVTNPRHVEIQVIADQHGNVAYLFERECSIQRRHQKLVEEAPSAVLSPELRKRMGEAAVNVCRACGYQSAGTVEFLVDKDLNFYFLEMNARLQVEHTVSEEITGIDLVREQIRIAEGEPLSFRQEDLQIRGHAIEIRVNAEDARNNFLPSVGKLERYRRPQGPGIRVDDGYEEGMDIPVYYDPMIAKLIVFAPTREAAMDRMVRAIDEFEIAGVETTLSFCRFVMLHEAFRRGEFDTGFIPAYFSPDKLDQPLEAFEAVAAALAASEALERHQNGATAAVHENGAPISRWKLNRTR